MVFWTFNRWRRCYLLIMFMLMPFFFTTDATLSPSLRGLGTSSWQPRHACNHRCGCPRACTSRDTNLPRQRFDVLPEPSMVSRFLLFWEPVRRSSRSALWSTLPGVRVCVWMSISLWAVWPFVSLALSLRGWFVRLELEEYWEVVWPYSVACRLQY